MKRIFTFLFVCAALFSCQKAELTQNESTDNASVYDGLVFHLDTPEAKTAINMENGNVSLLAGDKVKILYGETAGEGIVQQDGSNLWLATNIPSTEEGPFYGVYPSAINASLASSTLTLEIPRIVSGKWADANIMAAKTTKADLSFTFQHACAYVAFDVTEANINSGYNKFQLARATGNGKMYGTQNITFGSNGAINLGDKTENTDNYFPTVQYLESAGTYFFPVLAGLTMEEGVIIGRFKDSNGLLRSKLTGTTRGHIAALGEVCSKMTSKDIRHYITTDGTGDGSSWANAAPVSSIETITNAATGSTTAPQSWLSKNHYFCLKGATGSGAVYKANLSLKSTATITIMGGYVGSGSPGTRDIDNYKTYFEQDAADTPIVHVSEKAGYVQFYGLNFRNATISSNTGAAIRIQSASTVKIRACSFTGNNAGTHGGAVDIQSSANVAITEGSSFINNIAKNGGAIRFAAGSNGVLSVSDATFSGNAGESTSIGGGALYLVSGTSTFSDCAFTNNTSALYGGAASVVGGEHTMTGCAFSGNSAANGGAFGICCNGADAQLFLQNSTLSENISNNKTSNNGGGAIFMGTKESTPTHIATVKCDHVTFSGNKVVSGTASRGGAICMASGLSSSLMINACVFKNNGFEITGAKAVYGTAIACQNGSSKYNDAAIYNSSFIGGYATGASKANTCSLMLTGSGLLVNSTVVETTQSGDNAARYTSNDAGRSVIYNSIVLNKNASAITAIPSYGYVITNAGLSTPGETDLVDNSITQESLGLDFTTNDYGAWSGTAPAGYTKGADAAGTQAAIRSHTDFGEAFDAWLLSLDSNIYSLSGNGSTRTAPFWPGAYQN